MTHDQNGRINFLCPTYGRSTTHLPLFIESMIAKADDPASLQFTFVVNKNDEDTLKFLKGESKNTFIITEDLPSPHLAKMHNMAYRETLGDASIAVYIGDDFRAVAKGWDTIVREDIKATRGWALVSGPDSYLGNPGCPSFFFATRRLIDAAGEFVCPQFPKEGTDKCWGDIMQPVGGVYWDDWLVFDHQHSTRGSPDETFNRLRAQPRAVYGAEYSQYVSETRGKIHAAMVEYFAKEQE